MVLLALLATGTVLVALSCEERRMTVVRDFPESFLWGSTTAAHQVEGNNVNSDWWAWEHTPGSPVAEPSGDAIDHYHRFDADFALLASLGQRAHRFSVEWARIEPAPGEFSVAELDHYRRVLESAHAHGLVPMVTLQHFSLPCWLADRGGWLAEDAVGLFRRYVTHVMGALGDLIPWAGTVNEPNVSGWLSYLVGAHPAGQRDPEAFRRATLAMLAAHRTAVDVVKRVCPGTRVGLCLGADLVAPNRPEDPACQAFAAEMRRWMLDVYLDDPTGDFLGVQYYQHMRADPACPSVFAPPPEPDRATLMGWEIYPDGLRQALHYLGRAGLPLVVTESGIASRDDGQRVDYIESHVRAVRRAMAEGVDVRGFFYWSSFDNYEWVEGYAPTFGLIGIDRAHGLARVVRPSAVAYGRLCRTGRIAALREVAQ